MSLVLVLGPILGTLSNRQVSHRHVLGRSDSYRPTLLGEGADRHARVEGLLLQESMLVVSSM